jgi:hypothetical protein
MNQLLPSSVINYIWSHGKYCFGAKNMEMWEAEYIHLKAHGMYLSMLPSDVVIWTGVHMQFTFQHNCVWWSCAGMDFCKMEQHLYLKTALLWGRNKRECHAEVREVLHDYALPNWTVVRWVQVFKGERAFTADTHRSGCCVHTDIFVTITELCMDDNALDCERSKYTWILGLQYYNICLQLKMCKTAAQWALHH